MNAEIIAVGTELLLGDILNSNAQYLSQELAALGISVYFQTVVGDNADRLLNAYEIAFSRADIVITTGGLGPTEDDLTKEVASKYFNKKLIVDEKSLQDITDYFNAQNYKMTENNKKQAYIPEGAEILKNEKGTAPGIMIEEENKMLFMLPGPPLENTYMFENYVKPVLQSKTDRVFVSRAIHICGVGESTAESMINDLIDSQTNPTIAPYAKQSSVMLRVTASAENEQEAQALIKPTVDELYNRFGENIFGENDATLEGEVVRVIESKNMTIACAESCTGGMLTARLVDVSGVSKILKDGVVSYSNESKVARLGVEQRTLDKFGAVSRETAEEMAIGIAKTSKADIGISITGIAGPSAEGEKPVGLVYISISIKGKVITKELNLVGDRMRIRSRTVLSALDFLRREVGNFSE